MRMIAEHQPADGSANSGIPWLAEIIWSLHKDRKIGWMAVVAWARHVGAIGKHKHLLSKVASLYTHRMEHPMHDEPGWLEAIDEARALATQACDDALLYAKQGDAAYAEAALDCSAFDRKMLLELHKPIVVPQSNGRPNGNEL